MGGAATDRIPRGSIPSLIISLASQPHSVLQHRSLSAERNGAGSRDYLIILLRPWLNHSPIVTEVNMSVPSSIATVFGVTEEASDICKPQTLSASAIQILEIHGIAYPIVVEDVITTSVLKHHLTSGYLLA